VSGVLDTQNRDEMQSSVCVYASETVPSLGQFPVMDARSRLCQSCVTVRA